MNRIVFSLFAFAFVQLVSSQPDACDSAQTDLALNDTCFAAFTGTNFSVICMGSCRTLVDNIINNCNVTVSYPVAI